MRQVLPFLSLGTLMACHGGGAAGDGAETGAAATTTAASATGATTTAEPATGGSGTTTTATTTGAPWDTLDPTGTGGPVDNGPCPNSKLVLDHPGAVLWVTKDVSVWESTFLQPNEGFNCLRVEFDLQTLDNLADIAATDPDGCPERLGLASVFGTQIAGEVLATAFFRGMDDLRGTCTPGAGRLEVGNHLAYVEGIEGPWSPGQVWHVILEARPWLTRITLFSEGQQLGPAVAADLSPLSVEETRDPVVRLGLPAPVEDRFYPWYGATYANLQVWADVAPPP